MLYKCMKKKLGFQWFAYINEKVWIFRSCHGKDTEKVEMLVLLSKGF